MHAQNLKKNDTWHSSKMKTHPEHTLKHIVQGPHATVLHHHAELLIHTRAVELHNAVRLAGEEDDGYS
jgi:hypothetical protein